jgi:NAD(P)-dependent dehydrogenase (short-subunit alcohol dehydrogenase family)
MPLVDLSREQVDTIVETNLTGIIATMQVFAPMLFGREGASIVVTSSAAAEHGMMLRAVYSATKAGASGLVRSTAIEWGRHGVRVNAVAPGVIRTPLTEAYMKQFPEREEAARTQVPLGRVGTPEEVADVVVMLAGRATRFMTGQTLFIDGGLTAGSSWW